MCLANLRVSLVCKTESYKSEAEFHPEIILIGKHIYVNCLFPLASMMQTHQTKLEGRFSELQAFPSQMQSEESSNLTRPLKATSAITALESHRELHKELQMTHKRLGREIKGQKCSYSSVIACINH